MIDKNGDKNKKYGAIFLPVKGVNPRVSSSAWVAPTAVIVGDVAIGARSTIWFQAVVRGDVGAIRIGDDTNIQDHVVIHCTYQRTSTHVGDRVSIGHSAILHGCRVADESLVGMKAVVLDRAVIESRVIVAAGAVVLEGQRLKSGYLYAGVPAKQIKPLTEEQHLMITRTADNYPKYANWFKPKTPSNQP